MKKHLSFIFAFIEGNSVSKIRKKTKIATRKKMFFNVLITLLVSILLFDDLKYVYCTDEYKTIDALNTLLESSGWEKISNLQVHLPGEIVNPFSVSNLLLKNGADFDQIVNVQNYKRKYNMIVYSLSCVYANALVKFINLTKVILRLSILERRRVRTMKSRKKSHETAEPKNKKRSSEEENQQANEDDLDEKNYFDEPSSSQDSDDFMDSWKLFNCAVKQFKKSWLMFEYMSEALRFLQELVPQEYFKTLTYHKTNFFGTLSVYKDSSTDITVVLNGYVGEDDNCYKNKFCSLSRKFSSFLNATQPLDSFLSNYCIIPDDDKPQNVEEKYNISKGIVNKKATRTSIEEKFDIAQQLESQIETLVGEVTQKYFKDLGFSYNFTN